MKCLKAMRGLLLKRVKNRDYVPYIRKNWAEILHQREVDMCLARDDYFERINWNNERKVRMNIPFEEFNLDMFYEVTG